MLWKKHEWCFLEKYCLSGFPKRIRSLVKPLLKNSFSTNFQGTGPWEGNSLFIGVFPRFTVAANFFRADPGAKRRKRTFYKSNRSFSFYCSFSLFFSLLFSLFFSSSFSSSLSLSLFLPLSLPLYLSLITPLIKGNPIIMLNPMHYKYHKFISKKIDINCRQLKSLLNVHRMDGIFSEEQFFETQL